MGDLGVNLLLRLSYWLSEWRTDRRQLCEWRFRIKHGFWCDHHIVRHPSGVVCGWTGWRMANLGANKYRNCRTCHRWEWV